MKIRTIKTGTNVVVACLLLLGIIFLVNAVSARHFARLDLTENKIFSISEATKDILKNLEDKVRITAYISKNLPPYLEGLENEIHDILSEYQAYAGQNLTIEYVDPGDSPEEKQRLRMLGIPEVQLNVLEKDRAQVMNAYLGIGVFYEDKQQSIPFVRETSNLEYGLTAAIMKVSSKEVKKIGFLTGHDEPDLFDKLSAVRNELMKQYDVQPIKLTDRKGVPEDVSILVIAGPKQPITERDKFDIDQFIMRGGKVIFLLDAISREERGLEAVPSRLNLEDLLSFYGVKLEKKLVMDNSCSSASFDQGFMRFSIPYPFFVKVTKKTFNQDLPILQGLESISLPWTAPLSIDEKNQADREYKVLFKSTPYSWIQLGRFNLAPNQKPPTNPENMKSYDLAYLVSGKFNSFFTGKEIPEPELTEEENQNEPKEKPKAETIIDQSPETNIIVIGTSNLILDEFLQMFPTNALFFLNTIDWLVQGEKLIGIRSRAIMDRPLKELSDADKTTMRFINIYMVPILVVIFGLGRVVMVRKARFKASKMEYPRRKESK